MNTIKRLLIVTAVMGPSSFGSVLLSHVKTNRGLTIAMELNKPIHRYMTGRGMATTELFVELVTFVDQLDARQTAMKEKINEIVALTEEVGSQIDLNMEMREQLRPIMNSLFSKFTVGTRN